MLDIGEQWGKFEEPDGGRDSPPRYCRRCQDRLPWYEQGEANCFSCGHPFDARDPSTWLARRQLVHWRFWLPGFLLATASGILAYAICLQGGELGGALFFAVPVSFGSVLGYGTRTKTWLQVLLAMVVIVAVVGTLATMHVVGFFCGFTLGIIFLIPALLGVLLGCGLRAFLRYVHWDQRWFFLLPLMILPYGVQFVECRFPRRHEIATVRTSLNIHATPREAWDAVMFYEDVRHEPPWLLRMTLPRPQGSTGEKSREGNLVRCFYDRGYLVKRISRCEPQRRLAFDVVEQNLHFERDVTLLDGSFLIEPAGEGESRITLTTRYQRHLSPLWLWQPVEKRVVRALHAHVLEGMRRHAEDRPNQRQDEPKPDDSPSPRPPRETPGPLVTNISAGRTTAGRTTAGRTTAGRTTVGRTRP